MTGKSASTGTKIDITTLDPVADYLNRLGQTLQQISSQDIYSASQLLYTAWQQDKCIFICGNGGSAATASHMAVNLAKVTIVENKKRLKVIALTDNIPLMTAWANDSDFNNIFAEQLLNLIQQGDVVIGISTSGQSQNVLQALRVARDKGAICIGMTGDQGGQLKNLVDNCLYIPDSCIYRQEDGHLVLSHILTDTLRWMIINNQGQ